MVGASQSTVGSWLDYPMKQKVVFRGKRAGQVVYSGQPFPPEAAFPHPSEHNAPPVDDLRIPSFTGYVPPKMTVPREGSDVRRPKFAEGTRPAPAAGHSFLPGLSSECSAEVPAPAPTPAPAEEPAPEVANPLEETGASPQTEAPASDNAVAESDEPLEEAGFDYCLWRDGGVQVWGVEQLADGSFKISMEQLIDMREAFELAAGRHAREVS